jgi:hypothetical protein
VGNGVVVVRQPVQLAIAGEREGGGGQIMGTARDVATPVTNQREESATRKEMQGLGLLNEEKNRNVTMPPRRHWEESFLLEGALVNDLARALDRRQRRSSAQHFLGRRDERLQVPWDGGGVHIARRASS